MVTLSNILQSVYWEFLDIFLFSLGCYSGEKITVVDKKKNLVVSIKDARYNIDPELGAAIHI